MIFGAHISVAGGYEKALDYAFEVGCECAQIFAKSPRQWRGPATNPAVAETFRHARVERGFGPVFTHTAYLINLASENPELWEKSVAALADELVRGGLLGAAGVVTHVGATSEGEDAAARRVGEGIVRAFEIGGDAARSTRLLLENTAGAGHTFGGSFEQLAEAIRQADMPADLLGVCFDTCHGFAFGYGLDSATGWREAVDSLVDCVGVQRLGLIHANDCMFERGSHRDRHAWIGDGFIGNDGFEAMACVPELAGVCAVIEMPGEAPIKDSENLRRLTDLRSRCCPS